MKYTLHQYQRQLWNSTKRFKYAVAGIQSGKTHLGALWITDKIKKGIESDKQYVAMICAPTVKILNQSTLVKLFDIMPDLAKYYKKQESIIEVQGKFKTFIRSMDTPDSIEGMTCKAIWADEIGMMKERAWHNIQGRLAYERGEFLGTTTPYTLGWLNELIDGSDPDIEVVRWASVDSPYFPKEEYERAKRTLPPKVFARKYQGIFTKYEGLVYQDFDSSCIIDEFVIPNEWQRFVGVDYGFNAPFVGIFVAVDKDRNYYLYDEYFQTQCTIDENINRGLQPRYFGGSLTYPDPSRPDCTKELIQRGFKCMPVDNTIDLGIQSIVKLLKEKRLKVFRHCKNIIEEFNLYKYKDDSANEEPEDLNNDGLDALRYVIHAQVSKARQVIDTTKLIIRRNPVTGYPLADKDDKDLRDEFNLKPPKIDRANVIIKQLLEREEDE